MKLIIGGSSGFVGTELVRQALTNSAITSIIGVSRRETPIPPGSTDDSGKLKSVVCDNFESYSGSLKKELEDADACIWTIAVTPQNLKSLTWEETCKISRDYAITAIHTLASTPRKQASPLRFVYISGHFAPRKKTEDMKILDEHGMMAYGLLRGEAESLVLEFAEQSNGKVEAQVAKSGIIATPDRVLPNIPGLPKIELTDIAAALLDQVVNGFEKDTLYSDDMTRIGQKVLGALDGGAATTPTVEEAEAGEVQ
ncbi:hypothetical protein VMCG_07781 [Cytospora schulzeri]|uniref:NAD(P)-binding domain-containing protein n=1 Tax=Cytospora schulzeri TaxID=448051 RepID=A0A423VZT4_9PEZI|nr:hypothetical protein VMCG_07781 [Valsa malicola]